MATPEYEAGEVIEGGPGEGEEVLPVRPRQDKVDEPEDIALAGLLSDLGATSEAVVRVYETTGQGRKLQYLFECMPEEFSFDKLRDEYGGGDFRIHVRKPGQRGLIANKLISIKRTVKPETQQFVPQITPGQIAESVKEAVSELMLKIIPLLQPQTRQIDPTELEDRFMQRMLQMKTLFERPADGAASNIDLFIKGVELAKELGHVPTGEAGKYDLLLETVKTFGKPLADLVRQTQATKAAAVATGPAPAVQAPAQKALPAADDFSKLLPYLDLLIVQARANKSPELYAELILDQLDTDIIEKHIYKPDLIETLAKSRPAVLEFREWFQELQTAMQEMLQQDKKDLTGGEQDDSLRPREGSGTDATGQGSPADRDTSGNSPENTGR